MVSYKFAVPASVCASVCASQRSRSVKRVIHTKETHANAGASDAHEQSSDSDARENDNEECSQAQDGPGHLRDVISRGCNNGGRRDGPGQAPVVSPVAAQAAAADVSSYVVPRKVAMRSDLSIASFIFT